MTTEDRIVLQKLNEVWDDLKSIQYVAVRAAVYEITGWNRHYCAYILKTGRKDSRASELHTLNNATKQALKNTPLDMARNNNKLLVRL